MAKHPKSQDADTSKASDAPKASELDTVLAEIAALGAIKPPARTPAQNARLQDLEVERQRLVKAAE